ncbi:Lysosomal acid phosphatase, partial [Papilio machaon]
LFRHGARTPISSYKSDPFKNYQWPDGLGSLTNAGKLQLYELGKKYRNYYANFIPEEYYEKDVYVKSSDKSRCLMSAYTFLAGLYPPSDRQTWHPELPWQPIPVHSLPKDLDNLFRHGARTPVTSYKSDPFKNYQWPDGLGSLTNAGKLQLYELGKKYRNYYANFIPEEYYEKDVYVKSSDKSRCLMSAYTFLAGLYPPSDRQTWHPELPWQPIPVHSLPKDLDNIVAQTKPCKVWKSMYEELLEEANADPKFSELFDYLSKHTNQSMRSVLDVDFLYSTLQTQQEAGLKLPDWTKNVFPNKMRTPFMLSLALLSYNQTLQRLKIGKY